jgi:hypothetical protein
VVTTGVFSTVLEIELVDDMAKLAALPRAAVEGRAGLSDTRTNELVESDRICEVLILDKVSFARLFRLNQSMTFLAGPLEAFLFSFATAVC